MARIKYTALVESIRGSIAGTTFQRNAYGHTIKTKPNNVKPIGANQLVRQLGATRSARAWSSISPAERTAWEAYAQSFPIAARLNPDSNLNGYNYFIKYHNLLSLADSGGVLANPGTTADSFEFQDDNPTISSGNFVFGGGISPVTSDWYALLYATPPIPASQAYIRYTPRFMGFDLTDQFVSINANARYQQFFGFIPPVGSQIGVRWVFVNSALGQLVFFPTQKQTVLAP